MSDIQPQSSSPYGTLGNHLRFLREQQSESIADVSGAVEIDEQALERIEAGRERPAEDILMLLISHFNMQDQEAVQLWELAGYDGSVPDQFKLEEILNASTNGGNQKPVMVLFGIDARTLYTDSAEVEANNSGVTLTFGQQHAGGKQLPVAKVGMSYEQADQVLRTLQRVLLEAKYLRGPKQLPPSTDK